MYWIQRPPGRVTPAISRRMAWTLSGLRSERQARDDLRVLDRRISALSVTQQEPEIRGVAANHANLRKPCAQEIGEGREAFEGDDPPWGDAPFQQGFRDDARACTQLENGVLPGDVRQAGHVPCEGAGTGIRAPTSRGFASASRKNNAHP